MTTVKKGPVIDPGLCRCCGFMKKCRILNAEYQYFGQKEIYSDMFVDCFGLVLSHLEEDQNDRLICATCVTRLREAGSFKRQVLRCEEKLLKAHIEVDDALKTMKEEVSIKVEPVDVSDLPTDAAVEMDEQNDTEPIEMAAEPEIESEVVPKRTLRRRASKRPSAADTAKAKKEMLAKMKKIKKKLKDIDYDKPPMELPKWQSPKIKAFHNLITLVENSYVCPFVASFSNLLCVYCKNSFDDPDKLRAHTLTHDPSVYQDSVAYKRELQVDIARIDCRLCPNKIEKLDSFYEHITDAHDIMLYPNIKNEFLKFKLKKDAIACLECGMHFSSYHALKRHMAEHFGTYICDICGMHFFDEDRLVVHQRSHRVKATCVFNCKECGKKFKSKHGMIYHVSRSHSSEPTFHCYKCDEVFFSHTLRYRHLVEVHGEVVKKFECNSCDKVYDTRKSLREHNRKNHLKVLRHECTICDRKFYLPSALRDHMASHTGERNFRCEFCGKTYPRMRALRVHLLTHQSEKRLDCHLCSASYTQSNNLKNHLRTKHQTEYVEEIQ